MTATSNGYLYLSPVGTDNPTSSTLNFPAADIGPTQSPSDSARAACCGLPSWLPQWQDHPLIFDVTGYFTPDNTGATFHALTPARLLDSRIGTGGISGAIAEHSAVSFQVTGVGGVPANATAVTGNLTVTGQTSNGYLFLSPVGANDPTSSTLNFPAADDRANAVTVGLDGAGKLWVTFVAPTVGKTTDVLFDVTGYFTADLTGGAFVPLTPARFLDTRNGTGGISGPIAEHSARHVPGRGRRRRAGRRVGRDGQPDRDRPDQQRLPVPQPGRRQDPTSSTLNFPAGDDRANAATVGLGSGGLLWVTFVAATVGQTTYLVFDVTGYFISASI